MTSGKYLKLFLVTLMCTFRHYPFFDIKPVTLKTFSMVFY